MSLNVEAQQKYQNNNIMRKLNKALINLSHLTNRMSGDNRDVNDFDILF